GGAFILLQAVTAGCSHPPADATPEGALRLFLDDMDDSDDPTAMRRAYELLGPSARANLAGRIGPAVFRGGRWSRGTCSPRASLASRSDPRRCAPRSSVTARRSKSSAKTRRRGRRPCRASRWGAAGESSLVSPNRRRARLAAEAQRAQRAQRAALPLGGNRFVGLRLEVQRVNERALARGTGERRKFAGAVDAKHATGDVDVAEVHVVIGDLSALEDLTVVVDAEAELETTADVGVGGEAGRVALARRVPLRPQRLAQRLGVRKRARGGDGLVAGRERDLELGGRLWRG